MRAIPTINTARLTLRAMRPADFDRFAQLWATPELVQYIGGAPRSRAQSWDSFLRNAGHWQMTGFGQWVISDKNRQMIGQVGFFHSMREMGDDFDPYPEAGWTLDPAFQGQGYGREAVEAAHEWFDRVITGPLVAMIAPGNERSRELAEQMGYRHLRCAEYRETPVDLFSRPRP